MKYTTEDAVKLTNTVRSNIDEHGPEHVFASLCEIDSELLALTLVLSVLSR